MVQQVTSQTMPFTVAERAGKLACAIAHMRIRVKPGSQYDAGASVKSAEHNQRRIVNKFYVGTLGALVRATASQRDVPLITLALASYCEPGLMRNWASGSEPSY